MAANVTAANDAANAAEIAVAYSAASNSAGANAVVNAATIAAAANVVANAAAANGAASAAAIARVFCYYKIMYTTYGLPLKT